MMFYAPGRAMAEVRDRVRLGHAALLALLLHAAYILFAQWGELTGAAGLAGGWAVLVALRGSAGMLLLVAAAFVPLALFFSNLFERRGRLGLVFRQEYGGMAAASFYALAAGCVLALPLAYYAKTTGLLTWAVAFAESSMEMVRNAPPGGLSEEQAREMLAALPRLMLVVLIQPLTLFALWAVPAVRAVFRLTWPRALVVVAVSVFLMFLAMPLLAVVSVVLASPFLLLLVFLLLRGYVGELLSGQRSRASFRRSMEAATLNPADASAHYQLGVLHFQRRELPEARARFERAVEIDPEETDAHYHLGRIARAEGRPGDAIRHFSEALSRDPAHAQHEVWREAAATYVAAGQFADAETALEQFFDHRQEDPEGLYLMGRAQAGLGRPREAREWMQRCIEAVRTAPAYKYRADRRWLSEAQQFLRTLA